MSHKRYRWLGFGARGLAGHMARLRAGGERGAAALLASKAELATRGRRGSGGGSPGKRL